MEAAGMNVLIGIINLFVAPFISVGIYASRMGLEKKFSFYIAMLYASFTPMNMLCTQVALWIAKRVLGTKISQGTVKYTVFAVAAAVILPFAVEMLKKYIKADCTIEKKDDSGK